MLQERDNLTSKINQIKKELITMPEGNISCGKNGKYAKWWKLKEGDKPEYIQKSRRSFAEELAFKKYKELELFDLSQELAAINSYLNKHSISPKSNSLLSNDVYRELLNPKINIFSDDVKKWVDADYEKSTLYPEKLIHESLSGNMVRSKSEQLIDSALYKRGIPFRYECALKLGDSIFYPDFTTLNIKKKEFVYWEHLGMMDKPSYASDAFEKLQVYNSHGIIPSINLIITCETKDKPLTSLHIEKIIDTYFN